MPQIELLPASTTTSAPGWAYVPDTGYDPSKAAIVPSGARKRPAPGTFKSSTTAATPSAPTTTSSDRAHTRTAKQLAALDRENHRDAHIVPPSRARDVAHRGLPGVKMSAGVKRVLLSAKTFANHLADEEAALAAAPPPRHPEPQDSMEVEEVGGGEEEVVDPLLASRLPRRPGEGEMRALVAGAPLAYAEARAGPSKATAPPRVFCEMCGFWGRVRCGRCGVRVCGLECRKAHEESRCLKFYG